MSISNEIIWIYPTPQHKQDTIQGQFFQAEFSFSYASCQTKFKELSLPYYLPIVEGVVGRTDGFMHALFKSISTMWNANSFIPDLS